MSNERDIVERDARNLERALDAISRGRRPPRFPAEERTARMLRTAAGLRAARPGADAPDPDFVERLAHTLAATQGTRISRRGLTRRNFLYGAGAAAAATVAGIGVDRALRGSPSGSGARLGTPAELAPEGGHWEAVVALDALPPDHAVRFSRGAVMGFVVNDGGSISALSAVCTHMGCILRYDGGTKLVCPCHGAAFALDGSPLHHEYLTSLPRLRHRVNGDQVEVYVV